MNAEAEIAELIEALRESASLETVLHHMDRRDLPPDFVPQNARLFTLAADALFRLS